MKIPKNDRRKRLNITENLTGGTMVQLSNYEWKIMNLIWDEQPRTITQLTKALAEETGWSKHTVITYLKRLESKGAVHYE